MSGEPLSPTPEISALMRRFRPKDTTPELEVRRRLHAAGLRYRLHTTVPGYPRRTIDIAFTRARVAVFVDGCYWHACPMHGKVPARNSEWWSEKLARNVQRDAETSAALMRNGWAVVRVWEHQDADQVAYEVARLVRARTNVRD